MELATLGFVAALFAAACFIYGVRLGCKLHEHLAGVYKRNSATAYQEGVERAKREYLEKLERQGKEADKVLNSPLHMHKEEAERGFEEALANVYPNDPELQKKLKEDREFRKKLGK